jgi:hypothetical protein
MTDLQQALAQNNAEAMARTQDKILPELWELNRWMLASLLAINSAAAAAVYAATGVDYQTKVSACWFFIYGVLAALGSGFSLTFALRILEQATSSAQIYWSAVAGGAARDDQQEQGHQSTALSGSRLSYLPQVFLVASVVFFLIGISRLHRP